MAKSRRRKSIIGSRKDPNMYVKVKAGNKTHYVYLFDYSPGWRDQYLFRRDMDIARQGAKNTDPFMNSFGSFLQVKNR